MKKKMIGILCCMLMIVATLPVTGTLTVQPSKNGTENTQSEPLQSTPASPGFIGIKIVAKVTSVDDPNNLLGGVIQENDTMTGKYVYDPGIPDADPNPAKGHYSFTSSSCKFEVVADGLTFKNNPSNMDLSIWILNNFYGNTDEYQVLSLNNLQLDNGMLVTVIQWFLEDLNGTALDSDALPTTAPALVDWEQNGLIILGKDPGDPAKLYGIYAKVTSATKSSEVDVDEANNGGFSETMPFQYNQPLMHFWMKLLERFPSAFPILRHLMG